MTLRCKLLSILLILLLILGTTACAEPEGKGGEFTYSLSADIRSIDPQIAEGNDTKMVVKALFEGLCRLDAEGKAVAGVAESWEAAGTQYTFYLNDKAKWSNGDKVTAHDFVFGLKRALDPQTGAVGVDELFIIENARDIYYGLKEVDTLAVRALDDHTLVINLTQNSTDFPVLTAGAKFMPCNEKFFKETGGRYGLTQSRILTNGPFEFDGSYAWESGSYMKLKINEDYAGSLKIKPQTLLVNLSADNKNYVAVAEGELDMCEIAAADVEKAKAAGCEVISYTDSVTGILLNPAAVKLGNESVRELFAKSINKAEFLSRLPDGAVPASDIVPSGLKVGAIDYRSVAESGLSTPRDYAISDMIPAVLEKAAMSRVPSVTVLCPDDEVSTAIANGLISSWGVELGSYCNIDPLDESSYNSKLYNRDYEIALCTVSSEDGTAYSMLEKFSSKASPRLLDSHAYDAILHRESSIVNFMDAEKFLNNQFIFYPIFWQDSYYAVNPSGSGIIVNHGCPDFISAEK